VRSGDGGLPAKEAANGRVGLASIGEFSNLHSEQVF
jgi:hypothetical protein